LNVADPDFVEVNFNRSRGLLANDGVASERFSGSYIYSAE